MVETRPQPGWREVILIAAAVVAVVLGAAVVTSLLPTEIQSAIFHAPILIVVLIVGTAWLLWRISRPGASTASDPTDPDPGARDPGARDPGARDPGDRETRP